ncbi:MAG: Pirin family protein [Acidimicrobiales bacterium]|nr:Pirin family protein [Acidimicrobiales bacterium]
MSGPVRTEDVPPTDEGEAAVLEQTLEITPSRQADVAGTAVRRALPRRARRTVGAWCFADHMGPSDRGAEVAIGPHPHIGLQTVTWLVEGEMVHRDSLGSEQVIRAGQLNLMTAGRGISHAEEATGAVRGLHGIQLWVAQPDSTRQAEPAFEHHAELPRVELDAGDATVLIGDFAGQSSTARRDTDHVGVELAIRAGVTTMPLRGDHEHALVVLAGAVGIGAAVVTPGHLAYLGIGRDELALQATEPTRLLLLGGVPFESPVLMWWNFVARTRAEMDTARADWSRASERFGETSSPLERIPAPVPPWTESPGRTEGGVASPGNEEEHG